MAGDIEGIGKQRIEESPFVPYMKGFVIENNAYLIGRIAKVSSRTPYKILLLLRQVSREFASSPDFTKVVALHSIFRVTIYSQQIFMSSLFLSHFDALSFQWEVPNTTRFLKFMSARREAEAPPLKHVSLFSQEAIFLGLSNLSDEQFATYFGGLESFYLPSMAEENSAFDLLINQVDLRFRLQGQMKKLGVIPFISEITDEILQKILSSVQDIDFWPIGLDPRTIVRILTLYQGKALKRLELTVPMQIAQKSLTEEQQKRLFGELKELIIPHYIAPKKDMVTFKACLMSQTLTDVEIKGTNDFISSLSDQEMRHIFHSVKRVKIDQITPVDLIRVLSSSQSLKELQVPFRSLFSEEIVSLLSDQSLQRMFQNVRVLFFGSVRNLRADLILKLLGFMPHLRELSLMMNAEFSAKIMTMSYREMEQLFGKIRRLDLYSLGLTEAAFMRIMKYAVNIDHLKVLNKREHSDTLVRNRSPQVLRDIFGRLRVLTYEYSDFLENAGALCRFVEAASCLEDLSFTPEQTVDITEEDLDGLSDETRLRFARLIQPLACHLSSEIVGYFLNYVPGVLHEVVFEHNDALNFVHDSHMGRVINGVQVFESERRLRQDILIYRLLKTTTSLEKFDADCVSSLSTLFDNLSLQELKMGFSSLCSFDLKSQGISERALKKLLTALAHCASLTELHFAAVVGLNYVVRELNERILEGVFAKLTVLDLSGSILSVVSLQKILKATKNLKWLNLSSCQIFSKAIEELSDEELDVAFGQLVYLNLSKIQLSGVCLVRLLKAARFLGNLCLDNCEVYNPSGASELNSKELEIILDGLVNLSMVGIIADLSIIETILKACRHIKGLSLSASICGFLRAYTDEKLREMFGEMSVLSIKGEHSSHKQIERLSNCCPALNIMIEREP